MQMTAAWRFWRAAGVHSNGAGSRWREASEAASRGVQDVPRRTLSRPERRPAEEPRRSRPVGAESGQPAPVSQLSGLGEQADFHGPRGGARRLSPVLWRSARPAAGRFRGAARPVATRRRLMAIGRQVSRGAASRAAASGPFSGAGAARFPQSSRLPRGIFYTSYERQDGPPISPSIVCHSMAEKRKF